MLARVLDRELIRLQCYEGLDAAQALYEWDHPKQLLAIRACEAEGRPVGDLYDAAYLMERPLLRALRVPCVLLIDEIDRADSEFEAFLLEFLSDFQITIPELGTVAAVERPMVVMTSNRTRELHDALKRRCLYHWIDFPDAARERRIIEAQGARARPTDAADVAGRGGHRGARAGADQAAGDRRDDRVGAGGEAALRGGRARGRSRCGGRWACWSRSARTPRPSWSTSRRDARRRSSTSSPPGSARRDRLPHRAARQHAAATSTRLYWLARVTLVAAPRGHPGVRRAVRQALRGRRAGERARARTGETEAPRARRAAASSSRVVLTEGTGRSASRARPAQPPHVRSARPTTCARCGARWTSTCRGSARAAAGPTGAATSTCGARCARATRTGEITMLARRGRPHRTRPLLLLIDVSRLAARAHAGLPALRVGRAVRDVHVRHAAHAGHARAARSATSTPRWPRSRDAVEDADGGTRIGPSLHEFVTTPRYADRARGALTIVFQRRARARRPGADGARRAAAGAALAPAAVVVAARARPGLPADHARDGWRSGRDIELARRPRHPDPAGAR